LGVGGRSALRIAFDGPLLGFLHLHFTIAWRRIRFERTNQALGGGGHVLDRLIEGHFVRDRGTGRAAQLSYELQRRRTNLIVGRGRLEVREGFDVSAHEACLLPVTSSLA